MVKGHLFQAKCWAIHPSVGFHWFIMAKEIGNGNGKGFGKA